MFNFLRNITKSAEEKRQETVAAYLDGMLNNREQLRFEQEMAQDAALQAEVEQLRLVKQSLRQLPQREVPRNFILDPAQYGRPARQPWVQAYPVLRTATALAAFFFIFAVAAGIFTGFGAPEAANFAPAADVAQVDAVEIEITRVVSEEAETLAFESAADEAVEEAAGDEIAEAPAEEVAETAIEAEAEMMEEEVAAEEMAEEVMEQPPEAKATQPAIGTADALQGDALDEDIAASEPLVLPTPTVSTLPRVTPPTPLPDRDPEIDNGLDDADGEAADVGVAENLEEAVSATAVPTQPIDTDLTIEPATPLPWLQIGLGSLLLLLAGLTFYARRQR